MSRPRVTPEMAAGTARLNFRKAVQHGLIENGLRQKELGQMLDIGGSAMSAQLGEPDKIPVGRLRKIIQILHLDPMVILALLGYTDKDIKQLKDRLAA